MEQRQQANSSSLEYHPSNDHAFPSQPIGQRPCQQLRGSPDGWIDAGQQANLCNTESTRREKEGEESPGEAIIQVVHQPGLADSEERPVLPGRQQEDVFE